MPILWVQVVVIIQTTEDLLDSEHIIVSALDPRVADIVAQAVADAAKESGVVRE